MGISKNHRNYTSSHDQPEKIDALINTKDKIELKALIDILQEEIKELKLQNLLLQNRIDKIKEIIN